MATTHNGRIKKRLKFNLNAEETKEADRPRVSRMSTVSVKTRGKDGEVTIQKKDIMVVDNSHGRNERRATEIERLRAALKGRVKKKGGREKKVKTTAPVPEKKAKGKKKKGGSAE